MGPERTIRLSEETIGGNFAVSSSAPRGGERSWRFGLFPGRLGEDHMRRLFTGIFIAAIVGAISISQARATNSILFGAEATRCGRAVMCSTDGTRGYLHDGKGNAFRASAISKWFQINVGGKSHVNGQLAEPEGGSGTFLVVNDTGRPITVFALALTDNFHNGKGQAHSCATGKSMQPCNNYSAEGGSGTYKYSALVSDRPGGIIYSWRPKAGGAIPAGAKFTLNFSDWNNDAWPAPPTVPSIIMLSVGSDGQPGNNASVDQGAQLWTSDSANVVFSTLASNLPGSSLSNVTVYIYNPPSGALTPISTSLSHFSFGANSTISADGNFVGYAGGNNDNDYIYDVTAQTTLTIADTSGNRTGYDYLSGDGHYFLYNTDNDSVHYEYVWVYDRVAGTSTQLLAPDGSQPNNTGCQPLGVDGSGDSIAVGCTSTNLVPNVLQPAQYLWDQFANTFKILTQTTDQPEGVPGGYSSGAISSDGRYVIFDSPATNLVAGGTTGDQAFVYDSVNQTIQLVSAASDGTQSNGVSNGPTGITSDGRYVSFDTNATNLVSGVSNGQYQVYVKDLQTGDIEAISVASDGTPGNEGSQNGIISPDGKYVVFESYATNFVRGDNSGYLQVFLATLE